MLLRIILLFTICGGLFSLPNGVSYRDIGIIGLLLYVLISMVWIHPRSRSIRIVPLLFILTLFLFCLFSFILLKDIADVELFKRYFLLSFIGFLLFGLITAFKIFDMADLEKVVVLIAIAISVFSLINLIIISFFPEPFVVIALMTGTPVEDFARLYYRIILPFGNPAQLGLVAACSAFTILSFKKSNFYMFLVIFLLVTVFFTGSNSVLIPCFLIVTAAYLIKILKQPPKILYSVFAVYIGLFLVLTASYYDVVTFGRDLDNISESSSRHLMLRIQTLGAISNFNLTEMMVGVGAGQSRYLIDGSYSFTIMLTQMLEGGFLLVFIQIMYFLILAQMCRTFESWAVWWLVFLASFIYQLNNDISFYLYPLICILAVERTNGKNLSQS